MQSEKNSLEGLFAHFSFTTIKITKKLGKVKRVILTMNPDYDIVIQRLCLYYGMKLANFGIDKDRNLTV